MEIVSLPRETVVVGERKLTKPALADPEQSELVLGGSIRLMRASFERRGRRVFFVSLGSKPYGICMAFCHNGLPWFASLSH
ncbi:hypothetical protein [Burkholderia sp. S171]|uniref:hypothetical protein n=1 Tax=Burkholderia sp. S171 TaxID=1641860 RepID=UPI00131C84FB|nr:hypothetical protein [Burkholderia sp. S171]